MLDAGRMAAAVYDMAKNASRLAKAKPAHNELVATADEVIE